MLERQLRKLLIEWNAKLKDYKHFISSLEMASMTEDQRPEEQIKKILMVKLF